MTTTTLSRKQRLRTLENRIRKAAEQIERNGLEIGKDLCEIRDDELWKGEGYKEWNQYLKERANELVGRSFDQAIKYIRAAEIHKRLPNPPKGGARINDYSGLSSSHLNEINRLVPDKQSGNREGREKDYSKLRKKDVRRVLDRAQKSAGDKPPSVRDVRKAVDEELGIDRNAKASRTREERQAGIELADYLRQSTGKIQGITANLAKVSGESWILLEESEPRLAERLARACDELAELLRS